MKSSDQYTPTNDVATLCVGDPGSGKTRLGFAFPDPGILTCTGNLRSAIRLAIAEKKRFWVAEGYADDAGKEITEDQRWTHSTDQVKQMLVKPEIKTVVIDDFGILCRWGLLHVEKQLTMAGINVKKEYLAKYQAFIPFLTNFITTIRLPKKYIVVNVHQLLEKDETSGRTSYKLDIPGRLADNLGGLFTDVWGMSAEQDSGPIGAKYRIRTKPTGYHVNLKTSLDLEPAIDITGKGLGQIWALLEPKLAINTLRPSVGGTTFTTPSGVVQQTKP